MDRAIDSAIDGIFTHLLLRLVAQVSDHPVRIWVEIGGKRSMDMKSIASHLLIHRGTNILLDCC
jgi:hypothetical protein